MQKTLCIYHGNCADGFTAAWVVRKALGEDAVEFHAGVYQDPPPNVTDRNVVIVDFSYKRPVLLGMAKAAHSLRVLDHHKSAELDLVGVEDEADGNLLTTFDMERAGARITWDHFFPGEAPPPLLLHVEDRDLWRFALRKTREIQASVFAYPYEFKVWDFLMGADLDKLALEGEAIERKHFKDVRELITVVSRKMTIGGHVVPIANLPYTLTSDAGHIMAKGTGTDDKPEFPFAGCYWDTPGGRVFSLRSTPGGIDVSEVAKQYGGGGHRSASGFRLSFEDASKLEI